MPLSRDLVVPRHKSARTLRDTRGKRQLRPDRWCSEGKFVNAPTQVPVRLALPAIYRPDQVERFYGQVLYLAHRQLGPQGSIVVSVIG